MDTKSLIIDVATKLFQQKGYKVFQKVRFIITFQMELIACLQTMNEEITEGYRGNFQSVSDYAKATNALISKLIDNFETEGTLTGYTFSSMVSEMASLSDSVRNACAKLY